MAVPGVTLVGGLVGYNEGNITASYATGDVNGGDGDDNVGGLVGYSEGSIGTPAMPRGMSMAVPGMTMSAVWWVIIVSTTASYGQLCHGAANGGDGDDIAGGLVGYNLSGNITASYATGDVAGNDIAVVWWAITKTISRPAMLLVMLMAVPGVMT